MISSRACATYRFSRNAKNIEIAAPRGGNYIERRERAVYRQGASAPALRGVLRFYSRDYSYFLCFWSMISSRLRDISSPCRAFGTPVYRNCRGVRRGNYIERRSRRISTGRVRARVFLRARRPFLPVYYAILRVYREYFEKLEKYPKKVLTKRGSGCIIGA